MTVNAWLRPSRRPRLRNPAAVAIAFTMSACVAIPLSTMWKLHDMTAERFLANDPRQLRVAIRVDDAMKRGTASPQMRIDIDAPSTKPICYAFALDPIDPRSMGEPTLETAPPHRRWYAFALSQRGIDAFERARREVRTKDLQEADVAFNVTMNDVLVLPEEGSSFPFRIDVVLERKDGYFTMIKETDIKVAKDEKPAAPAKPAPDPKAKPVCIPTG